MKERHNKFLEGGLIILLIVNAVTIGIFFISWNQSKGSSRAITDSYQSDLIDDTQQEQSDSMTKPSVTDESERKNYKSEVPLQQPLKEGEAM